MTKRVIIKFYDNEDSDNPFVVITSKSQEAIQKEVNKIINKWESEPAEQIDWNYDELAEELEKRGFIQIIPISDYYYINA